MKKYEIDLRQDKKPVHAEAKRDAGYAYSYYSDFPVTYMPVKAGVFNIYLFGQIEDATQFISAIEVLNAASEHDVVIIHLSTNGGSLDATDTFIQAMRECEARIIVKASGGVHSAGTVILLNADEFTLSENFNALIHNGSCGVGGKFSDFRIQAKHTEAYMERVMKTTYAGFLSEAEIESLIDGKDIWLDADQFVERWEARNEILRVRMENDQDEVLAALAEQLGLSKEDTKKPEAAKKVRKPRAKKQIINDD